MAKRYTSEPLAEVAGTNVTAFTPAQAAELDKAGRIFLKNVARVVAQAKPDEDWPNRVQSICSVAISQATHQALHHSGIFSAFLLPDEQAPQGHEERVVNVAMMAVSGVAAGLAPLAILIHGPDDSVRQVFDQAFDSALEVEALMFAEPEGQA